MLMKTAVRLRRVLLLALLLVLCMPSTAVMAKTRLNHTRVTLTKGSKVTLKVKGSKKKVSWSIKGKKLVKITPKGNKRQSAVIKAGKKTGSCYVVAKVGKKTLRCKILVKKKETEEQPLPEVTPAPAPTDSAVIPLANASLQLIKNTCSREDPGKNILISPQSILTAIALLENGAAGNTLSEIETALGGLAVAPFTSYLAAMDQRLISGKGAVYQTANSVWYRKNQVILKEAYRKSVASNFRADVYGEPFDSSTVDKINGWVSDKTKKKITKIIDDMDATAMAVLINAIYFKGDWSEQYASTVTRTFTDYQGGKREVPMLEGKESTYVTLKGAEGFLKPYSGGDVAFLGLLPPAGKTTAEFLAGISGKDFIDAYVNRQSTNISVYTRMPEFTCEYEITLNDVLKEMGIRTAFTESADFSRMTDTSIQIDRVLHKTYIKLDKEGTEAAAVTAVFAKATAVMPGKMTEKWVYLDRPFVYAIIDTKTGLPLFLGTMEHVS